MLYQTTITKKGQITIPKEIRDVLKLKEGKKLEIKIERNEKEIKIKPVPDILVGTFSRLNLVGVFQDNFGFALVFFNHAFNPHGFI
jgi:AbrB family looped-hinge helix DNA binding protein